MFSFGTRNEAPIHVYTYIHTQWSRMPATLVYHGQTVRWIKMPLGTVAGLSPGDIVLDWYPVPCPTERGTADSPPLVGPCLSWPNGWMDQDTTWYRDRPQPRQHCVRWRPSFPHGKGHSSPKYGSQFTTQAGEPASITAAHVYCGEMVTPLSNC